MIGSAAPIRFSSNSQNVRILLAGSPEMGLIETHSLRPPTTLSFQVSGFSFQVSSLPHMGFFYRKSVNFGPFRVNLSKSGVGYSVGGKGFRVGTSARGRKYTAFSIPSVLSRK